MATIDNGRPTERSTRQPPRKNAKERRQKTREKASDSAQKKLQAAMRKYLLAEIASGRLGLSENRLAQKAGISRTKEPFRDGLAALEAQGSSKR